MKTRAAVAIEAGEPLSIEEVDLEGTYRHDMPLFRLCLRGVSSGHLAGHRSDGSREFARDAAARVRCRAWM